MPFGAAFAKGLTLRMGQTHVQAYLPKLLQHIERNEIDSSLVITQRIGFDSAENAYHNFNNQKDEWIKVVMKVA